MTTYGERRYAERRELQDRRVKTISHGERRVSKRRTLGGRRAQDERMMATATERWLTPCGAAWLEVVVVGLGFLVSALLLLYLWA